MKELRNSPAVVWRILCGLTVVSVALVEGGVAGSAAVSLGK